MHLLIFIHCYSKELLSNQRFPNHISICRHRHIVSGLWTLNLKVNHDLFLLLIAMSKIIPLEPQSSEEKLHAQNYQFASLSPSPHEFFIFFNTHFSPIFNPCVSPLSLSLSLSLSLTHTHTHLDSYSRENTGWEVLVSPHCSEKPHFRGISSGWCHRNRLQPSRAVHSMEHLSALPSQIRQRVQT